MELELLLFLLLSSLSTELLLRACLSLSMDLLRREPSSLSTELLSLLGGEGTYNHWYKYKSIILCDNPFWKFIWILTYHDQRFIESIGRFLCSLIFKKLLISNEVKIKYLISRHVSSFWWRWNAKPLQIIVWDWSSDYIEEEMVSNILLMHSRKDLTIIDVHRQQIAQ